MRIPPGPSPGTHSYEPALGTVGVVADKSGGFEEEFLTLSMTEARDARPMARGNVNRNEKVLFFFLFLCFFLYFFLFLYLYLYLCLCLYLCLYMYSTLHC